MEYMSLYLFGLVFVLLLIGYPVAFTLAGTALIFTVIGEATGTFDPDFLKETRQVNHQLLLNLQKQTSYRQCIAS